MANGKPGAPSKFRPEYIQQGYQLALLGLTDAEMGKVWGVSEQTVNAWKIAEDGFLESINLGKDSADSVVANRLFKRATGYSHPAVKIFNDQGMPLTVEYTEHYPPDTAACIFWLKNRQKARWRDKQEVESTVTQTTELTVSASSSLAETLAKAKAKAGIE